MTSSYRGSMLGKAQDALESLNQCDGCRRGLNLGTNGYHYDFDGSGALPVMACTKERYQSRDGSDG